MKTGFGPDAGARAASPIPRRQRVSLYVELGVWLAIAAAAYTLTFDFAGEQGTYAWGPASWPRAIVVLMVVAALVHLGERVRALRSAAAAGEDMGVEAAGRGMLARVPGLLGLFGLPLVYVYLLPRAGFYVSTPFFLAAFLFYLGERRPAYLLGVPLVIYGLINLVFTKLFYVALPTGTWPGFYDFSNWFLITVR